MSITSTSRIKTQLGLASGVTYHDTAIGQVVTAVNDMVLGRMGLSALALNTRTEYPCVYTSTQRRVQLKRWPVGSIVALTNAGKAVAAADYRVDDETGAVYLKQGNISSTGRPVPYWSDVPDDVVVTYTHGYTSATVPGRLRAAADQLALFWFNKHRNAGVRTDVRGPIRTDFHEYGIPPEVEMILAEYTDVHR